MGFPNRTFFRRAAPPDDDMGRPDNTNTLGQSFGLARGTAARFHKTGKIAKSSRILGLAASQISSSSRGTRATFQRFAKLIGCSLVGKHEEEAFLPGYAHTSSAS
jgi:hypothetical protein